jgi:hypothetical protein
MVNLPLGVKALILFVLVVASPSSFGLVVDALGDPSTVEFLEVRSATELTHDKTCIAYRLIVREPDAADHPIERCVNDQLALGGPFVLLLQRSDQLVLKQYMIYLFASDDVVREVIEFDTWGFMIPPIDFEALRIPQFPDDDPKCVYSAIATISVESMRRAWLSARPGEPYRDHRESILARVRSIQPGCAKRE